MTLPSIRRIREQGQTITLTRADGQILLAGRPLQITMSSGGQHLYTALRGTIVVDDIMVLPDMPAPTETREVAIDARLIDCQFDESVENELHIRCTVYAYELHVNPNTVQEWRYMWRDRDHDRGTWTELIAVPTINFGAVSDDYVTIPTFITQEAHERAEALLLSELNKPQTEQYRLKDRHYPYFDQPASDGVRWYRIYKKQASNVEEHDKDGVIARWCLSPNEPMPDEDLMYIIKKMIEWDEEIFRSKAIMTPVRLSIGHGRLSTIVPNYNVELVNTETDESIDLTTHIYRQTELNTPELTEELDRMLRHHIAQRLEESLSEMFLSGHPRENLFNRNADDA